jgi:hypothetical protein
MLSAMVSTCIDTRSPEKRQGALEQFRARARALVAAASMRKS